MKKLLVIIPDRISDLLKKGEITERYYNPGNLFGEVHILMTNNDKPNAAALQKIVGNAKLVFHNLPFGRTLFVKSFGYRPAFLNGWAEAAVKLAEEIKPNLIRCHGVHLNAYLAYRIKNVLGIPYIVSLHNNPDEDIRRNLTSIREKLTFSAIKTIEKLTLINADIVTPVYQDIVPYLKKIGVTRYKVAYNVLNSSGIQVKTDYKLHNPVRILSVGRLFREKNPDNIIRAVAKIPNAVFTIIGDGPYKSYLEKLSKVTGTEDRIRFITAISNDELCATLKDYDIFATHCDYWGIPKAVLEPLLTGLPVIINRRKPLPVSEYSEDFIAQVENKPEGYYVALKKMIDDAGYREKIGRNGYNKAVKLWAPNITEDKYAEIYRKIMIP